MKRLAIGFGIIVLAAGLAGFVPALTPEGRLIGIFAVDAMHNVVHIATGLAAIAAAMFSETAARTFFRIFGVVYGAIALMGFVAGHDGALLGMSMNMADHLLHVAISAFSLWAGFVYSGASVPPRREGLSGV